MQYKRIYSHSKPTVFSVEIPEPHLREGETPSRALPVSCLRHSGNAFVVPWPDHFSKAGDGPVLGLTVKSRQKGNDQEPIQSSSTSRPKFQTNG